MRVSVQHKMEGLLKELDASTFTVATTDNIDFLQGHASVNSGSQHHSWHGTSVQVIQTQQKPKNIVVQAGMKLVCSPTLISGVAELPDRRRLKTSPINSMSQQTRPPAYKCIKRARTFKEAVSIGKVNRSP